MCLFGQILSDILLETVFFMIAPEFKLTSPLPCDNSIASKCYLLPPGNVNVFP